MRFFVFIGFFKVSIIIGLACIGMVSITSTSFAMICKKTGGGQNWEAENIGSLSIPSDLPVGERLWTSPVKSRVIACAPEGGVNAEWVYFYGNPTNSSIMKGVGMGIIYNGADLGIVSNGHKIQTNVWASDQANPTRATYTFQVYLQKIGNISGSGSSEAAVFQLDGEGGLNGGEGSNYRYILKGLDKIKVSHCSVSIDAPTVLDFGSVSTLSTGVVANRDLSVTATKSSACNSNDKLGVTLMFSPVAGNVFDNDTVLDMGNGISFSLNENGRKIKFNNPVVFWDNVQSGSQHTVVYKAEIAATANLKVGRISKSIVLNINYL